MFETGKLILYEGIDYEITEVNSINSISLKPKQRDIMGKELLAKYMREYDIQEAIARWFISMKQITHGYLKCVRNAKVDSGTKVIDKLIRIDGYTPVQIVTVLEKCLTDTYFWQNVVLTLTGIRVVGSYVDKRGNKITGKTSKFDKVYAGLNSQIQKITDEERRIVMNELT